MTLDEATAKASQITFDRDLVREIALLVVEAVAVERAACAQLVHDRLGADGYGVAQMIRNRSSVR